MNHETLRRRRYGFVLLNQVPDQAPTPLFRPWGMFYYGKGPFPEIVVWLRETNVFAPQPLHWTDPLSIDIRPMYPLVQEGHQWRRFAYRDQYVRLSLLVGIQVACEYK